MFSVKQIVEYPLFVVHWEGYAFKTVLGNFAYEDVDVAHILAQTANEQKWHLNSITMQTNFKVAHEMFVKQESENQKFGIHYLGLVGKEEVPANSIKFKLKDLKPIKKKNIKI